MNVCFRKLIQKWRKCIHKKRYNKNSIEKESIQPMERKTVKKVKLIKRISAERKERKNLQTNLNKNELNILF